MSTVLAPIPPWMLEGSCRFEDPAMFFPPDGEGVKRAQAVCESCPVLVECRTYALEHKILDGVWGGLSERERRKILNVRRR